MFSKIQINFTIYLQHFLVTANSFAVNKVDRINCIYDHLWEKE
jgi:hypothetical protein